MNTSIKIPTLTIAILSSIVQDAVDMCPHIEAVGLAGSFARDEQEHTSDVDLLVRSDNTVKFHKILESFGSYVQQTLDYQFNKRLDIIRYDLACDRASRAPTDSEPWFCQKSFSRMLEEVKWLYERPNNHQ